MIKERLENIGDSLKSIDFTSFILLNPTFRREINSERNILEGIGNFTTERC
jgi:hypothetical protein